MSIFDEIRAKDPEAYDAAYRKACEGVDAAEERYKARHPQNNKGNDVLRSAHD